MTDLQAGAVNLFSLVTELSTLGNSALTRTSDLGVECPLGSLHRISSLPLAEKGSPVSY